MRKFYLVILTVVLLVVFSSCMKAPEPQGTLKGLSEYYTLGSEVTVKWFVVGFDEKTTYSLEITMPDDAASTISISASPAEYSFVPEKAGKYIVKLLASTKEEVKTLDSAEFYVTNLEITSPSTDNELYGGPDWDKTVSLEWKDLSGAALTYEYAIDDIETAQATTSTGVVLSGVPDGIHTLYLKIKGIDMPWLSRKFVVDTTPPELFFTGASREHQNLFNGDFDPNGRYAHFEWFADEDISELYVRFYVYDEDGVRYRLNLVDKDNDKTYDSWEVLPDASKVEHKWYVLVTDPEYWLMIISDKNMYIPGYEVDETGAATFIGQTKVGFFMENGFKRGMLGFLAYDKAGNESWNPFPFIISERYISNPENDLFQSRSNAPQITWTYKVDQEASKLYLGIAAPNLKNYVSYEEHISGETDKDTTFASGLLYMQIPVVYSTNLTLENVQWSNFMEGKKELNYHKTDDSASATRYVEGNVVYLYKGFVNGDDETEEVEDTVVATLVFDIDTSADTSLATAGIWYEPAFANYPNFKDNPNVVLVDNYGRQIDGVIVDNTIVGVPLEGGEQQ